MGRDDEAALLVGDLARHLGRGGSVDVAIAAALRERVAAADPFTAWAGLVVLGNGDAVPIRGGSHGAAVGWRTP
jgi:hypothetical protein